jgi:hypothetical protein
MSLYCAAADRLDLRSFLKMGGITRSETLSGMYLLRNESGFRKRLPCSQWRAVHGSKGSIASVVKKRKEKNSYINNSI